MAVMHCAWHEASPAKQPFDFVSLPLKHHLLLMRTNATTEERGKKRIAKQFIV